VVSDFAGAVLGGGVAGVAVGFSLAAGATVVSAGFALEPAVVEDGVVESRFWASTYPESR